MTASGSEKLILASFSAALIATRLLLSDRWATAMVVVGLVAATAGLHAFRAGWSLPDNAVQILHSQIQNTARALYPRAIQPTEQVADVVLWSGGVERAPYLPAVTFRQQRLNAQMEKLASGLAVTGSNTLTHRGLGVEFVIASDGTVTVGSARP